MQNIPKKQRQKLKKDINNALLDIFPWVRGKCRTNPQEPDYVYALTHEFSEKLYNILSSSFPQTRFSITGVYCHQKPLVDIHCSNKIELGDLLFVYKDYNYEGKIKLNSFLFQAKLSTHTRITLSGNELNQLELYKKWPRFTYSRAGSLNGEERDIKPKGISSGARYLLINNRIKNPTICSKKPCAELGFKGKCFSDEIIDFLTFKSGRRFYQNTRTIGWTKMIWDLLEITKESSSRRSNINTYNFKRVFERIHFCKEPWESNMLWSHIQNNDNRLELPDEALGIPMIIIESYSEND